MSVKQVFAVTAGLSLAVMVGCKDSHHHDHDGHKADAKAVAGGKVAVAKLSASKNATTMPAVKNVAGEITFAEAGGRVRVTGTVTGLVPNSKHGFHIHEKGDLSAADLSSAGAHYDPEKTGHHGGPGHADQPMHAGDLGNLQTDALGIAKVDMVLDNVTLDGAKNPIVGKSVIVHAKADDLKTQPSGDSGGRIAGGVIELKK
jgi:superoxide dismutase, Cu-Zn family